MIISASRRTDIPAYFSDWFFNRLKEGYVLVRNPMNIHQVGQITLTRDVVDGIVFWTKNPTAMLPRLNELEHYPYYFQFTLNPYGTDVEPNVPSKNDIVIPTFQKLSNQIGKNRVIWRYDPIFFNEKYTFEYHVEYFKRLCDKLGPFTDRCTISFLDDYRTTRNNTKPLDIYPESQERILRLMEKFSEIGKNQGLLINTCAEDIDLSQFNIKHAHCIELEKLETIGGCPLKVEKDKNQRTECGCIASIDIGMYNTCNHSCLYCYANYSRKTVLKNIPNHDSNSALICGKIQENDIIKVREVISCRKEQISLFD